MRKKSYQGKHLEPAGTRWARLWKEYGYLAVTVAVVFVVFRVILQLAWVPSGSMEPTIPEQSLLLSLRAPYLFGDPASERGDIVTFWSEEMDKLLVKRVIGLGGEEISMAGGYVYVNGVRLEEPWLPTQGQTGGDEVFLVPEGCYFMMGDNRTGSEDSRSWDTPYIPAGQIRSEVLLIISPMKDNSWQGIRPAA